MMLRTDDLDGRSPLETMILRALGVVFIALALPVVALSFGCGGGCTDDDDSTGEQVGEAVEEAGDDVEDALDD
ncbi:MAG: hypothetical protein M3Y87_04805 [Myxococcota bacterium]|nr:hypothetical protein [Myxococcota bacterium]